MDVLRRWANDKRSELRLLLIIAVVGAAAYLLFGRSGASPTPAESSPRAPAKYEQTWPKAYSDTTCREWTVTMTQQQMWAAAADMLAGARRQDGGTNLPSDDLVTAFKSAVTTACATTSTMRITDAGVGVYLTERVRFKP